MVCRTYNINELHRYKYVVILSKYNGKILLSRHKERTTWETQGGHIEVGESPMERNLDAYEAEYEYELCWMALEEAIAKNESIEEITIGKESENK